MQAINNAGLLALISDPSIPGFVPAVGYTYSVGDATIVLTDNTTYPAGDAIHVVQCNITDGNGNSKHQQITVTGEGGAQTVDVSGLDPFKGFNVTCTVVSTNRLVGDLGMYGVGSYSAGTGNLRYANKSRESKN